MHYNENSDRMQAVTAEGEPRYSVRYRRFKKGECSVQIVKEKPTYGNKHLFHHIIDILNMP